MAEDDAPQRGGNFLTKKVGPLPVWAYGAIGGGLILVLLYAKKKSAANAASAATATAAPQDTTGSAGYTNTGGYDNAGADSVLGQLESNLGATNQTLQNGVSLNPTGTSQVQQAVGTTPVVLASNQPIAPVQANGTALQYVTAQYQNILGRTPSAAEAQGWVQMYQQNPTQEQAAFLASAKKENPNA